MLKWEGDYLGYKAETERGTYRMDGADSLGQIEVNFEMGGAQHHVGVCFGEDAAMAAAEKHNDWVSNVVYKGK